MLDEREFVMTIHEGLRMLAGLLVTISVALTFFVSDWFMLLTLFIGVNLIQSAFTGFCPGLKVMKILGLKQECHESEK